MSSAQGIVALTSALVHPSITGSLDRARHEAFMARTLSIAFATFAVAPFFIAFHGAPCLGQTIVFLCGLSHLAAAVIVGRGGRLDLGHLVCFAALSCVGLTLFAALHAGVGCAIAWLMLAQVDATQTRNTAITRATGLATVAMLAMVVAGSFDARFDATMDPTGVALATGFALVLVLLGSRSMVQLTGLARAEDEDRSARWLAISETLGDTVVGFDAFGAVDHVSREGGATFGAGEGELLGRGLFDRVHVADRPTFLTLIADAARSGETVLATVRIRAADPRAGSLADHRHLWVEMRARRSRGLSHESARPTVVALLRDVTVAREQTLEMDAARRSVDAASTSKDQFIANMSHELRTPLNAIIGFSEILGSLTTRPTDPEKQRDYARIINQSGHHLLSVVNSILDLSKLQSGALTIIAEPFDVAPLLDYCCETADLKTAGGMLQLVRDYPADLEAVVGDRRACQQIVIHLLSNAVKFTPPGGQITVRARQEGNTLVLCVGDTGIGIGAADLARLGTTFFQARSTAARPFEGAGLGLSVVRGLIGLIGGTIAIESEPGAGTSVTVRLPLDCRTTPSAGTAAPIETIGRRRPIDITRSPAPRMKQSA